MIFWRILLAGPDPAARRGWCLVELAFDVEGHGAPVTGALCRCAHP